MLEAIQSPASAIESENDREVRELKEQVESLLSEIKEFDGLTLNGEQTRKVEEIAQVLTEAKIRLEAGMLRLMAEKMRTTN